MATQTTHYNLIKPDLSDPVKVSDLNGNFDIIDEKIYEAMQSGGSATSMIANTYSSSATYAVGDYCEHSGKFYRCNTEISTAEEWTAAHWTEVTVGAELEGKVDQVTGKGLSTNDLTDALVTKINGAIQSTEKGVASGVATLDSSGKVPSGQLPSYVDDIINGYYYNGAFYEEAAHTTQITPETGKIYVDLSTDKSYRWSGSVYVRVDDITIDATPTQNSPNAVRSGGVFSALAGKANNNVIAPDYSTSATYAVGDYVMYNGALYRCNTAITTAESWTAAHWTAAKIGPDVDELKNTLSLLDDEIPDTVQTITFDQSGNVQSITHSRNNAAVRTDVFTFAANSVTEVRTLSTGQSLTIVTNLSTLETTITYSEGGN